MRKLIVAIVLVCVLVAAVVAAVYEFPELRLHMRLRLLAGWGATNCGIVKSGREASAPNACVLQAFTDQKPFFVVYDTREFRTPSALIDAMAADKDGNLYDVEYIGRRWFFQDLPAAARMFDDRYIFIDPCPSPPVINASIYKGLTCSPRIMVR
jgi:hypothetical protein